MTQPSQVPWTKRLLSTQKAPAEGHGRLTTVANNLILHLHPVSVPTPALRFSYTWGLGGISALLAALLGLTGLLLAFRYDAHVENAYLSIQLLETRVMFGSLVRALHHWSANLLVIITFLHLIRVFLTGSYKQGRSANWQIGIALFLLVLASNFTGYLLPWDQLAFWAITVSTSLLGYIPLAGDALGHFILGGPLVGQGALTNFYALHVVFFPALSVGLMGYHFWKVRKNGGISQPIREAEERAERAATIPHLVERELAAALAVFALLLLYAMRNPAPLGPIADQFHSPNPAKAAWYFMGLQELLLHMHPLAAMGLVGAVLAALFYVPKLDKGDEDIGVYFRSELGKRTALLGSAVGFYLTPLLVILDEFWLDIPGWLPGLRVEISAGVLPFLIALGMIAGLYRLMRSAVRQQGRKANHSEAMLGVFAFIATSLVMLTLIGVYFRGENMALTLPF